MQFDCAKQFFFLPPVSRLPFAHEAEKKKKSFVRGDATAADERNIHDYNLSGFYE